MTKSPITSAKSLIAAVLALHLGKMACAQTTDTAKHQLARGKQ